MKSIGRLLFASLKPRVHRRVSVMNMTSITTELQIEQVGKHDIFFALNRYIISAISI